ncbi:MAG TPA: glycerol kinase GlpK [Anaerolineaceae bacterium]|nr:glycerol kinase GlpK [Anaerolineaceae bacterium]
MARYIAALHQGTLHTSCMIFNHSGRLVSVSQKEHRQIYLQPDRVEHNPLEIWERAQATIRVALSKIDARPGDIAAVGITNQRETTVVWNSRTGRPYYNAIVWQDTRPMSINAEMISLGGQDIFRSKTGLPLTTYFSGLKIKWIMDQVPGVRADAERGEALFGTIDSWLIWWLTGGPNGGSHVTDVTNASRTLLMNLHTLDWDPEILTALGIPRAMLPRIVPSSDPRTWGTTLVDGPFGDAIPVCGDLGDQQAPLVGQACFRPGEAKNTYGIACFMLLNTGTRLIPSKSGLLTTVAYQIQGQPAVYALEGSIATTGALIQWLRDNLGIIRRASEVEDLARSVEDNGGIYIVPAFTGLFAPYWRSDARGVIAGLTHSINKGHLARAALEAIAYQTREVLDAMKQDSGMEIRSLKVDGEMIYNELLMQFQADILGVPVVRPEVSETASLGAAYVAGLATQFWDYGSLDDPFEDLNANWHVDKTWYPRMSDETRSRLYTYWLKAVQRTFGWRE